MISRKSITLADDTDIIPKLREVLPHGLSPRTYLAWNGDELVAGAIVMTMGDTAHYLYGATAGPGLKLRASYALHWHIVEQLARENFKYYDLGGSSGFEGLRQFKSGLSGSEGFEVDIPDEYDYGTNLSANMCGNAVHQLRSIKGMHIHAMNKFRLGGNVA